MDHTFHEYPLDDQPYPREDDRDKLESVELLDECWFFTNLLHTKPTTTMSKSLFDPANCTTTSSNYSSCPDILGGKSYEETYESIAQKQPAGNDKYRPSNSMERDDPSRRGNLIRETSSKNLLRVPSLPTILRDTDDQFEEDDEEMEFSMGKLIRQASLNSSDTVPPITVHAVSKGLASSSSMSSSASSSRNQSRMKPPEMMSCVKSVDEVDKLRPQRLMRNNNNNKLKTQKSMSYLESEEVGKLRSTNEYHMKARIKFWARAVASNVDQES